MNAPLNQVLCRKKEGHCFTWHFLFFTSYMPGVNGDFRWLKCKFHDSAVNFSMLSLGVEAGKPGASESAEPALAQPQQWPQVADPRSHLLGSFNFSPSLQPLTFLFVFASLLLTLLLLRISSCSSL